MTHEQTSCGTRLFGLKGAKLCADLGHRFRPDTPPGAQPIIKFATLPGALADRARGHAETGRDGLNLFCKGFGWCFHNLHGNVISHTLQGKISHIEK